MAKAIRATSNARDVSRSLTRRAVRAAAAGSVAARAMAEPVVLKARETAPRGTGALVSSLGVVEGGPGVAYAGAGVEYARFPELGTRYQQAQHFLSRALADARGESVLAATRVFRVALK